MKTAPSDPDLTFVWPVKKGFPFVLFVCVAGSLFAHAATFFLFQVVYPQRVTIPQPSPHVSLLTPSTPENIALLRWIEAEDPALIAGDNSVSPPALAKVQYRPSFATPRTAPLGAPAEKPIEVRFPPAVDQLTVPGPPVSVAPVSRTPAQASTFTRFSGLLSARPLIENPPLVSRRQTVGPIIPTVLLVGVSAEGDIRYQFLQQSSGDSAFDEIASAHLQRLRFAPAEVVMTWAHATIAWGAEVYAEARTAAPPDPEDR